MGKLLGRPDTPKGEDGTILDFDLEGRAQALSRFVASCDTPMTVGIQGEWGSGKTSLMRRVARILQTRKDKGEPIHLHTFETWQYGAMGEDSSLGIQLIATLTRAIAEKHKSDDAVRNVANKVWGIAKAASRATVAGSATVLSGSMVNGAMLADGMGSALGGGPAGVQDLRADFQKLVNRVVAIDRARCKAEGRFIIFVDDLDRVRPGRAVTLLEVMKNFMDVTHCVFVIACDYDVVRLGVQEKFGIRDDDKVRAYFHKIIQVPFRMPVQSYQVRNLLKDYLEHKLDEASLGKVGRQEILGRIDDLAHVVQIATGTNPRGFKRFLNVLDLHSCVHGEGTATPNPWLRPADCFGLVGMVALQTEWPEMAAHLARSGSMENLRRALEGLRERGELDKEEDADLIAALSDAYGSDTDPDDWVDSDSVARLRSFADHLYRLLDEDGDDDLSAKELEGLLRWSKELGLTGIAPRKVKRRGFPGFCAAVSDSFSDSDANTVKSYLYIAKEIQKAKGDKTLPFLWTACSTHRLATGLYVAQEDRKDNKTPAFLSFSTAMRINLNAGPGAAAKVGFPELNETVGKLVREEFGWRPSGTSGWVIDFGTALGGSGNAELRKEFLAHLWALLRAANACTHERWLTKPEPAPAAADRPEGEGPGGPGEPAPGLDSPSP